MLRHLALTVLTILSLQAAAANDFDVPVTANSFDFLPASQPAQKEFKSLTKDGKYQAALMAWGSAHANTSFGDSDNGTATLAYLLYKTGMPYLGLKTLVQQTKPQNINASLLRMWHAETSTSPYIQKGWITGNAKWTEQLKNEAVQLKITNKKDIRRAFARVNAIPATNVNARARIWWQVATLAPTINDLNSSLQALRLIKASGQTVIGADMVASVEARVLYQKGDLEGSMKAYQAIPKSSSIWLESVEERAWIHLRRNDFDKALGEAITLLSPALSPLVGPESYYLASFLSLKACDYPRIFKNSETFKARHRERLSELQELANKGTNKDLNKILENFDKKGVSLEAAGGQIAAIPRATLRDQKFNALMQSRFEIGNEMAKAAALSEANALGEVRALSKFLGEGKVDGDRLRKQAIERLRALAKEELNEYRNILNKLHVVEAEAIQRLHVDDSLKGERSKLAQNEDQGDVMVFPYTTDEVWFDELDNYKARVKDCPTLKGASL